MSESYHYRGPSIDHSLLSPSGRCSKRARDAAMRRETTRQVFRDGSKADLAPDCEAYEPNAKGERHE